MNEQLTAQRVKELRKEKGLTQAGLGEVVGLDKFAISNIENGRRGISASENTLLNAYFFGSLPESVTTPPMPSSLVLHFERSEFRRIQEAARAEGMLVDEWAEKQLAEIANMPIEDVIAACRDPELPAKHIDPHGPRDTSKHKKRKQGDQGVA